jgi:hypothetical protein
MEDFIFRVSDPVSRLISLGLPTYLALPFWAEVEKWRENNGPAWTVDRLKQLKTDLIRQSAGLPPLSWIRKNRKGRWFGAVGAIFRYSERSPKAYRTALLSLMIYSAFEPKEPTPKHVQKLRTAVGAKPSFLPLDLKQDIRRLALDYLGPQKHANPQRLVTYQGSPSVRAPIFGERSVPQDKYLEKELLWVTGGAEYAHFSSSHSIFLNRHYDCYGPVLEGVDVYLAQGQKLIGLSGACFARAEMGRPFATLYCRRLDIPLPGPVWGGRVIPLTKDGGWKVRWIASPCRLHQLALRPLGKALYRILEQLPWDCTFDQEKALVPIQKYLRKGGVAHAVDLSSATDHFPLELQLEVLGALFPQSPYVRLFGELSRSNWSSPVGTLRWTKGQPMGLYPSFASFGLTHGLLLLLLAGGIYRGQFYVLGDDVVILDQTLFDLYLKTLDLLECPRDVHKSISSDRATEFAGRLITRTEVIPQYKWKAVSDDNFLDFAKSYGQSFASCLTTRQRQVYNQVARLLPPYGCNHSIGAPKPFLEVWKATEVFRELATSEGVGRSFYTSFLSWLGRCTDPSREESLYHRVDFDVARRLSETLDEKVSSAFRLLPRPLLPWQAVTDLFEFTGITPDLTAVGPTSHASRLTTLGLFEKILKSANKDHLES